MNGTAVAVGQHGVFGFVEIELLERDKEKMRLLIQGVDVPFINSLRRTIIAEVPCMAVDEVVVIENSSVLQDEMIAHRLGLMPLKTDLDSYNLPEECPCKSELGCNLCRVSLELDSESPEGTRTVYSGELVSENPSISPVSDRIPIAKLAKGQKLKLEAYARLGKGKKHAKWQPVSMCTYKYFPEIAIDTGKCDACGRCVEICPNRVLTETDNKIDISNLMACTLCQDCADACPKDPSAIEVKWKDEAFIFNVESTDAIPPERAIEEAIKIMDGKLSQFMKGMRGKRREKN